MKKMYAYPLFYQLEQDTYEYCRQSEYHFDSSDVRALLNNAPYVHELIAVDHIVPDSDHTCLFVMLTDILEKRNRKQK